MKKFILFTLIISCFSCESTSQKILCNYELAFDQALGYGINKHDGTPAAVSTHVAKCDSILPTKPKDSCLGQSLQRAARVALDNSDTKLDHYPEEANKDGTLSCTPHTGIQQGDTQFEVQVRGTHKKGSVSTAVMPARKLLIIPLLTSKRSRELSVMNTQMQTWHNEILKRLPLSRNGLRLVLRDSLGIRGNMYGLDTWFGRPRT